MMRTAPQTITNANSVPMFVRCKQGVDRQAGRSSTATKMPMAMVLFHGVRKRGWTSAKNALRHQAVARHRQEDARALSIITSSTDVMPATPARAMMN